ncbi:Protein NUCLEAR FUSION DEFECTIVE like [Actinidia chinensis var. chinensis]|uniref:Protein NUCLEAR FUSION DEFECTIVE like n=1 Tax=Actinidia chinensis var. chinensis TaxID=1590841 RepID=A0A2R6S1L6_ACTCC|nr:Protein NUCLEAR FUSION DEFECTIVE like [Actinidia chinensis var. chinensis]
MVPLKAGSRPPWVGLGASVWLQIASGNAYTFPLYSHSLKSVLGFNQRQVTMLGVANDIGENVGIVPGIACNKFPPWVVLLVGAFASFFGYGVLWLAVSRTVESLPYWLVSSESSCSCVYVFSQTHLMDFWVFLIFCKFWHAHLVVLL